MVGTPMMSVKTSLGREPPRLGTTAGLRPRVWVSEPTAHCTAGWLGSSRVAFMISWLGPPTLTASKPCASRCFRRAGRKPSGSLSTVKRIWQCALARGGTALTGRSGLPVLMARTSKVFQANTFSDSVNPRSPHQVLISGPSGPGSTTTSAKARRTESGMLSGNMSRASTWPLASMMEAIAWHNTTPGLASKPPQLPEWCPPSRNSIVRSKLSAPRVPMKIVGIRGARRGPSEPISKSALSRSRCRRANSCSPGEPISSQVSIRNTELKPSLPRVCSTLRKAAILMECWPLLSAVPRP